jgi:hypothetical protein
VNAGAVPVSITTTGSAENAGPSVQAPNVLCQSRFTMRNLLADAPVLFRIQTTSPYSFRVRPSHGRIEAGQVAEVTVLMLAESSKKVDKFQINFAPLRGSEAMERLGIDAATAGLNEASQPNAEDEAAGTVEFSALFKAVESQAHKYRLRCVLPAGGAGLAANVSSAIGSHSNGNTGIAAPVAPTVKSRISSVDSAESAESAEPAANARDSRSSPDPRTELQEARAKISRLTAQNQQLTATLASKSAQKTSAHDWAEVLRGQYGVPPVLLLLVAVFAFLVGLLF